MVSLAWPEEFSIKISSFLSIAMILLVSASVAVASGETASITAEDALEKLLDGNGRFASGNSSHRDQSFERRAELLAGQHPFAVIVGCSDSRIAPEVLFDQGLGDIFVIRTAGQVLDNASLGSIEYAVEHLGVPLVMVLGHDSCGAVSATVQGGEVSGHLESLVQFIQPAVDAAREAGNESLVLDSSIDNNIWNIVEQLESCEPLLSEKVEGGEVMIVGARYHMDSGIVEMLE